MPKFHHRFTPRRGSPLGNSVELDTREIEDAGVMEVLQTPGAALGTWAVFDALLVPGHEWFVFHSPLGQSREVKTALSGLFGRFVARAYASRYLGYTHFQTIHSPPMALTGGGGMVRRSRGMATGDLPDWAAWSAPTGALAIIEAKGCNAHSGLGTVLTNAYEQAKRATIMVGRRNATFKRFAIATRWGVDTLGTNPMLWVKDPVVEGSTTPAEQAALGLGLARLHYASLMRGLGLLEIASALSRLATPGDETDQGLVRAAVDALESAPRRDLNSEIGVSPEQPLIGSYVTRGGLIPPTDNLNEADFATLAKLRMRPAFVGVEVTTLKAAITGDLDELTTRLPLRSGATNERGTPRVDLSGAWISRPEEDQVQITDIR